MALKALDQRLANKPTSAQPSPSLASTSAGPAMELGAVAPAVENAQAALADDKIRVE